ncbi:hypothetical protein ARMSODRAFT_81985 [Armillaria solidipes]|uniref:Uncharacterized protein n=1 Tax=Armillaria solidipes TaxID=1076256 RepID=A0A2H3AIU6_9AGAR|nr:hypothetical protein ARMSODRAFT_81985 [Armillaria solidipes]
MRIREAHSGRTSPRPSGANCWTTIVGISHRLLMTGYTLVNSTAISSSKTFDNTAAFKHASAAITQSANMAHASARLA